MKLTPTHIQSARRHLRVADPVMKAIIDAVGPYTLRFERDRFAILVRSIISQQISTSAARAIRKRLQDLAGAEGLTAANLVRFNPDQLRSAGLSPQKAAYVADLAAKVNDGGFYYTPMLDRQDESRPYETTRAFFGGQFREIRYKLVERVLWRTGAGPKLLRLVVVAPTPYQLSPGMPRYYRQPAYLLATGGDAVSIQDILQCYFDRWQIEVNHREEKDTLGVGQAQLWNVTAVPKQPVLVVATTSAPVAAISATLTSRTWLAVSACTMLYTPALPQQRSGFSSSTSSSPGIMRSRSRGWRTTFCAWRRWHESE